MPSLFLGSRDFRNAMAAWTVLISDGNLNELLSDIEQLAPYYNLSGIDECGCTTAMSLLDPRTF